MGILVAVDLSKSTEKVVKQVEVLGKALSAKVWLLHVAEPEPEFVGFDNAAKYIRDARSELFHNEHRQIQAIADRLRKAELEATALLVQGFMADCILHEAAKLNVKLIVLGSHGHGNIYDFLVGSVSEAVLHKATCPVLIVPTHERESSDPMPPVLPHGRIETSSSASCKHAVLNRF